VTDPASGDLADTDRFDDGLVAAAPGSALEAFRARRKRRRYVDLRVPDTEPAIWVRYGPLPQHRIDAHVLRYARSKDKDRTVKRESALLAEACIGVFEVVDGREVSIDPDDRDGEWPTFGERLAELLGIPATSAGEVVRDLYGEDAAVMATSAKYADWLDVRVEERDDRPEA
jgi:hypothetical protein